MSKDPHDTHSADLEGSGKHQHDDDPIVVPKGSSRTRFLMTALLAVLVLTTFTVSHEVVDVLTGRNRGRSSYMSWKRPAGSVETLSMGDFMMVKQDISRVQAILSGGRNTKDHDDVQTARHIIADEMAKEAGVEVTDDELRKVILPAFGNSQDIYIQTLDRYRTTAKDFEDTLRALIRVDRYIGLLSETYALPDPTSIVDQWKKSHKEYSVEFIELDTDRFEEEAKGGCPSGDELHQWFDALPEAEKGAVRVATPPKVAAEFSWLNFDPPTRTERLLAKFPRPASEKPADVAQTWYEANKNILFKKPGIPAGKPPTADDYRPFDEVKDIAQAQGIAYQSILDWWNDVKMREGRGESITLVSEGAELGLAYRQEITPRARAEWKTLGMAWSGNEVTEALYGATGETGKLLPDVLVDAKALIVGRVLEKQAAHMPEFAEFQDKAHDYWIKKKRSDLAVAKLELLRAKLPSQTDPKDPAHAMAVEPDSARWQAAAQELGLEVKAQDWFDAGASLRQGQATPVILFLRQVVQAQGDVAGAVSKPELSTDKSKAWLARVVASRDPNPDQMNPLEYQNAQQLTAYESHQKFYENTFGSNDYMKQRFGLELEAWRREAAEQTPASK
jgi:hypothetical protein